MVRYVVRTTQVPFTPITYNVALRNLKMSEAHAATVLLNLQKRRSCKFNKCVNYLAAGQRLENIDARLLPNRIT